MGGGSFFDTENNVFGYINHAFSDWKYVGAFGIIMSLLIVAVAMPYYLNYRFEVMHSLGADGNVARPSLVKVNFPTGTTSFTLDNLVLDRSRNLLYASSEDSLDINGNKVQGIRIIKIDSKTGNMIQSADVKTPSWSPNGDGCCFGYMTLDHNGDIILGGSPANSDPIFKVDGQTLQLISQVGSFCTLCDGIEGQHMSLAALNPNSIVNIGFLGQTAIIANETGLQLRLSRGAGEFGGYAPKSGMFNTVSGDVWLGGSNSSTLSRLDFYKFNLGKTSPFTEGYERIVLDETNTGLKYANIGFMAYVPSENSIIFSAYYGTSSITDIGLFKWNIGTRTMSRPLIVSTGYSYPTLVGGGPIGNYLYILATGCCKVVIIDVASWTVAGYFDLGQFGTNIGTPLTVMYEKADHSIWVVSRATGLWKIFLPYDLPGSPPVPTPTPSPTPEPTPEPTPTPDLTPTPTPLQSPTPTPTPVINTVFQDGFEINEWNGLWTEDSQNDWSRSAEKYNEGGYAAKFSGPGNNSQLVSNEINFGNNLNATINFFWYIDRNMAKGEYIALDVSTDSGLTWTEKLRLKGNVDQEDKWSNKYVRLLNIDKIKIRFRGTANSLKDKGYIDAIKITVDNLPTCPSCTI